MTLADKFTSTRLILAPLFFVVFFLPLFFPSFFQTAAPRAGFFPSAGIAWTVPVLWILFIASEITDMLDGIIARKRGEVSDFGKFFDPLADTLTQITYFLCFVIEGVFPAFLFLIVLYREFGILFVRNLMLRKGVAMGAQMSGKIKTVTYIIAGALALIASSITRLGKCQEFYQQFSLAARIVFVISVGMAVFSFFEYLLAYKKTQKSS
jgi:CDP-diacylglycerol--glycerol-3-phosphate 3-phosphatidyltransferase